MSPGAESQIQTWMKKEEQKNVKLLSMNSTNNGQGLYNV
jgi:hypothetical protein